MKKKRWLKRFLAAWVVISVPISLAFGFLLKRLSKQEKQKPPPPNA